MVQFPYIYKIFLCFGTVKSLKFALKLGEEQIIKIGDRVNIEEQKISLQFEAVWLYLRNFWSFYGFLSKKLNTERKEHFHYFIPLLRTLIEIYGQLLYFLNQKERIKIGIFISNYLLHLSNYFRFIASESSEGRMMIENEYKRFLNIVSKTINEQKMSFSSNINKPLKSAIETNGFNIPTFQVIFSEHYFEELSIDTFLKWEKDNTDNFYDKYYRTFSDYTHRGFANQTGSNTKTEKYWIEQFLYLIAQLMIELCNKKLFNLTYTKQYDMLSDFVRADHRILQKMWGRQKIDSAKHK